MLFLSFPCSLLLSAIRILLSVGHLSWSVSSWWTKGQHLKWKDSLVKAFFCEWDHCKKTNLTASADANMTKCNSLVNFSNMCHLDSADLWVNGKSVISSLACIVFSLPLLLNSPKIWSQIVMRQDSMIKAKCVYVYWINPVNLFSY